MKPWADEERLKDRPEAEVTWNNFEVESGLAKIKWMARISTWPKDYWIWTTPPNFEQWLAGDREPRIRSEYLTGIAEKNKNS
jgi:hypothetical protein